jgi:ZIP family zinc transporter
VVDCCATLAAHSHNRLPDNVSFGVLIAFAILPFFSTLLGGSAAIRLRHRLHPFMAFAAGVLVATALADLLPEANDLVGAQSIPILPGAAAVVGFLLFSALEAFIHRETWEHEHQRLASQYEPGDPHEHASPSRRTSPLSIVGPISLIAHSTLDGLAIGLAFRASGEVGLLVGLAVLAHDFADGMNVVTLALAGGGRLTVARLLLFLDALAPPIGAAIGTFIQLDNMVLGFLLAGFAGVFLAVGAGHLLPEANHHRPGQSVQLVLLTAAGAALVLIIRALAG